MVWDSHCAIVQSLPLLYRKCHSNLCVFHSLRLLTFNCVLTYDVHVAPSDDLRHYWCTQMEFANANVRVRYRDCTSCTMLSIYLMSSDRIGEMPLILNGKMRWIPHAYTSYTYSQSLYFTLLRSAQHCHYNYLRIFPN